MQAGGAVGIVGKPERATQDRVIRLFRNELGYRFLGPWGHREGNDHIEESLLNTFLLRNGYTPAQISRAIYRLRTEADNHNRGLYGNNQAVYNAPAPALEEAFAERVALILWRLGRVTAYERDTTARARQQANEDLSIRRAALLGIRDEEALGQVAQARTRFNQARHWLRALASLSRLPDDATLSDHDASDILGAVDEQLPDLDVDTIPAPGIVPDDGQDWTVGRLLRFLQVVADAAGRDAEQLLAETLRATRRRLNEDRVVYDCLAPRGRWPGLARRR